MDIILAKNSKVLFLFSLCRLIKGTCAVSIRLGEIWSKSSGPGAAGCQAQPNVHTLEGSWERRRWQFGDPAPEHQGPAAGREEFLPTWEGVQDRQPRTQNLPGPKFRMEPGLT